MPPAAGKFSISISGNGSLIGPVVSEVGKAYPTAKFNDRTQQFRDAVAKEQAIAGRMDRGSQARVGRAARNLAAGDSSDFRTSQEKTFV